MAILQVQADIDMRNRETTSRTDCKCKQTCTCLRNHETKRWPDFKCKQTLHVGHAHAQLRKRVMARLQVPEDIHMCNHDTRS